LNLFLKKKAGSLIITLSKILPETLIIMLFAHTRMHKSLSSIDA